MQNQMMMAPKDSFTNFQVEGVLLVAPNASSLSHRRKEFLRAMKDSLVVKHDQRATSHRIASSLEQVKVRNQ